MDGQIPPWIRQKIPLNSSLEEKTSLLKKLGVNTVCQTAQCPNIFSCWQKDNLTFMILGRVCSRSCTFCAVEKGIPEALKEDAPQNILKVVKALKLNYVIVTSVTRDDLEDGGVEEFVKVVNCIKAYNSAIKIELLIPDFKGRASFLKKITDSLPEVIAHNIETTKSLYPVVRPEASYKGSLEVLALIKRLNSNILTKSSLMLGLGERFCEVIETLKDLREVSCDIITIGQYLSPSIKHIPVKRYIPIEEFDLLKKYALSLGFKAVESAPLVRSSYCAESLYKIAIA